MTLGVLVLLIAGVVGYLAYIVFEKQRKDLNKLKTRLQGITCDGDQCAIARQVQISPSKLQGDMPFAVSLDLSAVGGPPSTDTPQNGWGGVDIKFPSSIDDDEAGAGVRALGTNLAVVSKTKDFPGST